MIYIMPDPLSSLSAKRLCKKNGIESRCYARWSSAAMSLGSPKYQVPKYEALYQCAFDELKSEGKIKVIPDPSLPSRDAY